MIRRPTSSILPGTLILCALLSIESGAQQTDSSLLTVNRIFGSSEFDGEWFGGARWLDDSTYTMLEPAKAPASGRDIVRYDAASGRRSILFPSTSLIPAGATKPLAVESFRISPDGKLVLLYTNSRKVWRQNTRGDYWVLDRGTGKLRQLGGNAPASTLMFAKFSPDSRRVAYVSENNLYVEDVETGRRIPLTSDGSRTMINGTFDWVYEEELDLRDGFRWSPDGKKIAYWQLDASGVRNYSLINDTDSLYSYVKPVQYPKAGEQNSAARVGVVSADGGPTQWIAVPGDPRNNYIARMEWAANSNEIVLQHLNRLQNTNDVMLGDVRTGAVRTILTERDSAWVDVGDEMRWLDGGSSFTWSSERDGWRHLYQVPRSGGPARLVTPGAFDAAIVAIDTTSGWVYYSASPDNPTQSYLYRSPLRGSARVERITPNQPGTHYYTISPGGRYAFHSWSSFGVPYQFELVRLPSHQRVRTLVDNPELRARLATLRRGPSRFFKTTVGGNTSVDGWMMLPPNFDSTRKYPVLFEVYGEPAGSTVGDSWGGSGYLWDLLLTQHGYIVMSVDNRGTATPRGRAWRKIVYGEVGVTAVADQAIAAKTIGRMSFVDSTRMGVWGWSGGGSTTLGLLFTAPDVYRMGMAVAPVSDKRYYDTIYQERYMGLPATNVDGYRRASALPFAKNLKADLLIVHGSGDDNVHYQNTEAVVNALIEANKPFQLMVYPNRTHCICEGDSTQVHLFTLLTRYVDEHLGGKGSQR